mgnify:CR=1 FL=1
MPGKSSLLNILTGSNVIQKSKLFSTLDPTTRKLYLKNGNHIAITDTVGFINKLPTTLIDAFHATLEEINEADILLHVIDISNKNAAEQTDVVKEVLEKLNITNIKQIMVLNKIDKLTNNQQKELEIKLNNNKSSKLITKMISVKEKTGIDNLIISIEKMLENITE